MADSDALRPPGFAQLDARHTGDSSPPRVALTLGSGGARGYAHIGVIHELRDRGYQIAGIAGSSMGALVGGLQAAGRLDEFAAWARPLTQRAILRLLDPSITAAGVLRAGKILDAVRDILGAATIEQLPIPYTAVATDLLAGKSVWLQRGPVDEAIRASIAIPGVIAPHVVDGRLLADGGILDPLPMAPIAAVNADLTIAISLSGSETDGNRETEPRPPTEWLNRMLRSTSALFDAAAARSLLDRPTARAVLNRFGASIPESPENPEIPESDTAPTTLEQPVDYPRGGARSAQAGQFRGDEPHHRHRPGRAGAPHPRRLPTRPADRGAALGLPRPGIPPGG
jgi:NTE family protein